MCQINEEEDDSGDDLMAISIQALQGTEGMKTIRFRGFLSSQEVFMLIDSGSSHSFINKMLVTDNKARKTLSKPTRVKVANRSEIPCTQELPSFVWGLQGHTFKSSFKIIPLGCYDVILGIDWLSPQSHEHTLAR